MALLSHPFTVPEDFSLCLLSFSKPPPLSDFCTDAYLLHAFFFKCSNSAIQSNVIFKLLPVYEYYAPRSVLTADSYLLTAVGLCNKSSYRFRFCHFFHFSSFHFFQTPPSLSSSHTLTKSELSFKSLQSEKTDLSVEHKNVSSPLSVFIPLLFLLLTLPSSFFFYSLHLILLG